MLLAVQAKVKGRPDSYVDALVKGYHLDQFGIDTFGAEALRNISRHELQRRIDIGTAIGRQNTLSGNQGKAYQDFVSGIENTFSTILKSIERTIVNSHLLGAVQNFMGAIGKDINMLVSSGAAAKGLDALASGIQRFANYLGSKDFQDTLTKLEKIAGMVAHPVKSLESGVQGLGSDASDIAIHYKNVIIDKILTDYNNKWHHGGGSPGLARTNFTPMHVHIDPLPLIKIHITSIPGSNPVTKIQQMHGGAG